MKREKGRRGKGLCGTVRELFKGVQRGWGWADGGREPHGGKGTGGSSVRKAAIAGRCTTGRSPATMESGGRRTHA
jgi:hypothetical protein